MTRWIAWVEAWLVIAIAATVLTTMDVGAEPYVPAHESDVLLDLPARTGASWDEINRLREVLASDPADPEAAARLASTYLELFREEGEPRLIGYAAAALSGWRDETDPPRAVALQLITIDQIEHRFDAAMQALDRYLERYAADGQAWLMKSALALTVGRYDESRKACARTLLSVDATTAGACIAAVDAVAGDARRALGVLNALLARTVATDDGELESWLSLLAAETAAALDRWGEADARFREALEIAAAHGRRPRLYLLAAYADFLLDVDRYADVVDLLSDAPAGEAVSLRLAAAKRRLGMPVDDERQRLSRGLALVLSGRDDAHAREAAYYLLHVEPRPERALAAALVNWQLQKEPIDARLVLEAAIAACEPQRALPVVEHLASAAAEHRRLRRLTERLEGPCA